MSSIVSLSLSLFDPEQGMYSYISCSDLDFRDAVGSEDSRSTLWGSMPMRRRAYRFFPVLLSADLFVFPHELDCFKRECVSVWNDARLIAAELPDSIAEKWCPIGREIRLRVKHIRGARQIRTYIRRIQYAIELAEPRKLGVSIS